VEAIKATLEALQQASMKLGEVIYKEQGDAAGAGPEAGSDAPADDDVVDADFEEVDEDKK